jgi:protein TonB
MSVDHKSSNRNTMILLFCLAAAAAVVVVVLVVGIFLMPLIYPAALPKDQMAQTLTVPPPPPPPPPPTEVHRAPVKSEMMNNQLAAPDKIGNGHTSSQSPAYPKRVVLSAAVAQSLLIMKTPPNYPPIAKAARVSGTVVLQATISTSGSVINLHVVSGPAMLQQSAIDAVRMWKYRPFMLNNQPVQFETTINVIFTLSN